MQHIPIRKFRPANGGARGAWGGEKGGGHHRRLGVAQEEDGEKGLTWAVSGNVRSNVCSNVCSHMCSNVYSNVYSNVCIRSLLLVY